MLTIGSAGTAKDAPDERLGTLGIALGCTQKVTFGKNEKNKIANEIEKLLKLVLEILERKHF